MAQRYDDSFELRVRPPRRGGGARDRGFLARVAVAMGSVRRGKGRGVRPPGARRTAKAGRGAVAAAFAADGLGPRSRRVIVKARLVRVRGCSSRALTKHLQYLEREGATPAGDPGRAYDASRDAADLRAFDARTRQDGYQFRFIVSPEDATRLAELRDFTRGLMGKMERDLGTRLDWVAVDHWDTDNPHTHIVLRGVDESGEDLFIAREYISHGMRFRACKLATDWLGPRTEREIWASLDREVGQERWTSLDQQLQARSKDHHVDLTSYADRPLPLDQRARLIGRLQRLEAMGLAREVEPSRWQLRPDAESTLRSMGERGDIIRSTQRALSGERRELEIFDPDQAGGRVVGRLAARGLVDGLSDKVYAIVDGIDGRAHYVPIGHADLNEFPVGGIVEARPTPPRAADRNVAALSQNGVYLTAAHRAHLRAHGDPRHHPDEIVDAHVRRLEALRRAGIVEREAEGIWRIPPDLATRGHAYDRQRTGGVDVRLHSHLPVDRQVTSMGATWLDQTLVNGDAAIANAGFGASVKEALRNRVDFLVEHGFAQRDGERMKLPSNLLTALRQRDLDSVAKAITAETGMSHRPLAAGERATGVYRRMVVTASGRFAMLDDGLGFSLVPWRPVLEQRVGQQLTATIRGDHVTWSFGRQRGLSR
jgi:type IV secretory pathway VirD2 relaxase